MYTIGISALYHDSAVCVFENENLIYACEEEKFSGIKHDSSFPHMSLNYAINEFNIKKNEIECVCYYENLKDKKNRIIKNIFNKNITQSIFSYFQIIKNIYKIKKELSKISKNIFYSKHHLSHQYYSYYSSSFKNCSLMSIDGVGEEITTSFSIVKNDKIVPVFSFEYPHSIGLFYSAMTSFLGFRPNEGEYKLMGLSSYGCSELFKENLSKLIFIENKKLKCNMDVFCWNRSNKKMFTKKLCKILKIYNRNSNEEIKKEHMDLAAAVQEKYEELLFCILNNSNEEGDLCLGGGCAYNGLANGKITKNTKFKNIWIPVAPSDAGSCVGACLHYFSINDRAKKITKNPFLGPSYEIKNKEVADSELFEYVSKKLYEGKVVGWYQGKCEFGARALGNRSILANPTLKSTKERLNKFVKKREAFRPFAPMVTKEKQHIFFELYDDIPYMNQVVKVREEYKEKLPSITHIDGTARVQTVYGHMKIHKLLEEFEKLSGIPVLVNTSFNIKDKTMVLTPDDAIRTFLETDIDILVLNNSIIEK